ncbi:MAG: chorismate-binding protein [Bacteroidetes bacterium]|nr:chorismate-binding protein [Bacteroidota bacterium]
MKGDQHTKDLFKQLIALDKKQSFNNFFKTALKNNKPVAMWRLPNDSEQSLIIDLTNNDLTSRLELENLPEGFLFSPFDLDSDPLFIQADIKISTLDAEVHLNPLKEFPSAFIDDFIGDTAENGYYIPETVADIRETTKANYLELVRKAIDCISNKEFQKVVPAKAKIIQFPEPFNPVSLFQNLCDKYPRTFVSLVSIPKIGTWIGATPELLLSVDRNNIFTTASLAGTQLYNPDIEIQDIPWTQKEIEEQAMVSRFIINCFKTIRLREFDEIGPRTIIAGNLAHLKTIFEVDMSATDFYDLGSVMLKLLHPTSAVCGLPKDPSYNFIKAQENFDRQFFSGYLGPINSKNNTSIFVNLRCMQLLNKFGIAYSGAGVTAYSNPEKEWEETEMKCATLLRVLG